MLKTKMVFFRQESIAEDSQHEDGDGDDDDDDDDSQVIY